MTYKCQYKPSPTNGHWHQTQDEATRCILAWAKWNNPPRKELKDYSNHPNGVFRPDMDSRSEL